MCDRHPRRLAKRSLRGLTACNILILHPSRGWLKFFRYEQLDQTGCIFDRNCSHKHVWAEPKFKEHTKRLQEVPIVEFLCQFIQLFMDFRLFWDSEPQEAFVTGPGSQQLEQTFCSEFYLTVSILSPKRVALSQRSNSQSLFSWDVHLWREVFNLEIVNSFSKVHCLLMPPLQLV